MFKTSSQQPDVQQTDFQADQGESVRKPLPTPQPPTSNEPEDEYRDGPYMEVRS